MCPQNTYLKKKRIIELLTKKEIQISAKQKKKHLGVIEKDYAIEWLLYGIYHKDSKIKDQLIFKGGTALRKIFYPKTWRFSEDLDFSMLPETDDKTIISGFDKIYDIIKKENQMEYNGSIEATQSRKLIQGRIHFIGPLGTKNNIKIDISGIEKMAEPASAQIVTVSYKDLENFTVNSYTINEILAEKIRSMMQRIKARDYYDVWRMLEKGHGFDTAMIGRMVRQKCTINEIEYDPAKIFDPDNMYELKEYWQEGLERLVEKIPDPDAVFGDLQRILAFLPAR